MEVFSYNLSTIQWGIHSFIINILNPLAMNFVHCIVCRPAVDQGRNSTLFPPPSSLCRTKPVEQLKAAIVSHNCALIAATGDGVHGTWLLGSVEQVTSGAVAAVISDSLCWGHTIAVSSKTHTQ